MIWSIKVLIIFCHCFLNMYVIKTNPSIFQPYSAAFPVLPAMSPILLP